MFIKDFVLFNPKGKKPTDYVNYIDTSSVEDGKLLGIQYLTDNIPSRAQRVIEEGDILISSVRPILKHNYYVSQTIENGIASTGFIQIRADRSKVIPQYLYYFLTEENKVRMYQTIAETSQSTFPSFNKDVIENMAFPDVSLAEQQHIVDILGSIDDSIENNEKIAANLEDYAISKYQEITRGTSDFITLGEIVDIYDSKRKPLSSRERESCKGDYRYYGATGVLDYVNDYLFDGEYVLLAEDGTVIDENGYPIVQLVTGQFWVNNHAHIMQAKAGYTNYSLYVALKKLSVNTAVTGAVQLKINQANLCALEMPRIDENKLLTFNQEIEPLFLKIIHIRAEIEKLKELKQLYLHKFFG